ncbi:MAG: hypothetical protein IPM96_00190 [Ignavibacteria bacterium]|nr:hypothetical protein [Ignavibacteria bacterium]
MSEISSSKIICPQCGGENSIRADEKFLECEYCGSSVFIDKRRLVSHFVVNSNFTKEQAEGNLRRWMAGNYHVKDLDKLAQITQVSFYYFPLWYFKTKDPQGDRIHLQPAHSTPVSEIKNIQIPAGNLKPYHKNDFTDEVFVEADVLYDSAKSWLSQSGVNPENISESSLVNVPFYHFYYLYKGQQYSALVEASSGMVYANIWPAKSEMPFKILFAAAILLFGLASLASFAVSFWISPDISAETVFFGEFIKIFAYILAAVPLTAIAYWIVKKV